MKNRDFSHLGRKWMKATLFTLFALFCSSQVVAQTPTIKELEAAATKFVQGNTSEIPSLLERIDKSSIDLMSDTIQFYYHFLSLANQDLELKEKIDHAEKAMIIRENSLGVLDAEYFILINGLHNLYQLDGRSIDESIRILNKGYVIGVSNLTHMIINPFKRSLALAAYTTCLDSLADAYHQKGWASLASFLYAFEYVKFSSTSYPVTNEAHFLPLIKAYQCFEGVPDSNQSIHELSNYVKQYLEANNFTSSVPYAIVMMYEGKALMEQGKFASATTNLIDAINIIKQTNKYDNKLALPYYWGCLSLAANGKSKQLNKLMSEAQDYYNNSDNSEMFSILKKKIESQYPGTLE